MKTIYKLEDFESPSTPISLTIGNFDGVHLGHQAILSSLTGHKVVFTFSNHPVEVLNKRPFLRLTTNAHRLHLLAQSPVDTTILLPFTEAFSEQSADEFLTNLHGAIPFSRLVLGPDAVIGEGRRGNPTVMQAIAERLNFCLEYLSPVSTAEGEAVSSSRLRELIREGAFAHASKLLGRPYSILTTVEAGEQRGRLLGFPTANLKVYALTLPPLGVYVVQAVIQGKRYLGVANLGQAPTVHADRPPILEVHLLNYQGDLYRQEIEVFFLKFLRPEKRFSSIEALQAQIERDVQSALAYGEETAD